ncbi:hypothetical protein MNBD_BACTEROID03-709 [hydrothermal vent metagenome]|uniref:Lipoprotein n=1 Tax=hydrothermal vent metagenome TaxID=652676 RepID=A0A3B0T6P3_9ZZZZ
MENMKTLLVIIVSVFLSVLGCTDNEVEMNRRDYIIENETEVNLSVKFYNKVNGTINNQTSKDLNKGEQLSKKIELTIEFDISEDYPSLAYGSDSVRIVFNNEKFLTSKYNSINMVFSEPIGRNIFRHSNYENLGNERYLFKITQQDYENAEDCNGNCD